MLLNSKHLNMYFDVATIDKADNGKVIHVVKHDSLRDIFLNQYPGLQVNYQVVSTDVRHSVVLCRISDDKGRVSTEIGESLPNTLTDPISKNYPTLMAFQRAFDRALIAFLNFDGKVLSDLELGMDVPEDVMATIIDEETQSKESTDNVPDTDAVIHTGEELHTDEPQIIEDAPIQEAEEPINPPVPDSTVSSAVSEEDWGEKIINFGKFKGQKAKDIVIPENKNWLRWFLAESNFHNPPADAAREILTKVNEQRHII